MLRRTEGIVLRTFPFGEADLICTFLTPDCGLIKVFAKSPRKIRSRFGSSLEPFTCARISFWGKEDAALPRLTQADIAHSFQTVRDNLHVFMKVSEIIGLTVALVPEKDANTRIYRLLYNTLLSVERVVRGASGSAAGGDRAGDVSRCRQNVFPGVDVVVSHYRVKFLGYAGFAPKLDSCARCGKKGFCFYVSQGAILCGSCAEGIDAPVQISEPMRRLYEDLLTWDTDKVQRIRPSPRLLANLSEVIQMHIRYILPAPVSKEAGGFASGKVLQ